MNQIQQPMGDRQRMVGVVTLAVAVLLLLGSTGWLAWKVVRVGLQDGSGGLEPQAASAPAGQNMEAKADAAVTLAEVVEAVQSDDVRIVAWRKEMVRFQELDRPAGEAGGAGEEADQAEILIRGLRAAVAQKPESVDLCCSLGVMLLSAGQPGEAVDAFARGLAVAEAREDTPRCLDLLLRRGTALRQLQRAEEARADERRASGLISELFSADAQPDFHDAREVRVEFGSTIRQAGLYVPPAADSKHGVGTYNGQECWFFQPGNNYCYLILDPTFKPALKAGAVVRVEYAVVRGRPLILHYDSSRSAYALAPRYSTRIGTNGWNVLEFTLTNTRFRNSQNSRADLRLYGYENGFYLKSIAVLREAP